MSGNKKQLCLLVNNFPLNGDEQGGNLHMKKRVAKVKWKNIGTIPGVRVLTFFADSD